jgi:hypothetical protein
VVREQAGDLGSFRRLLFGDIPLEEWPPEAQSTDREPWTSFVQARAAARHNEVQAAVRIWQAIVAHRGWESRHILQAWYFLRQAGIVPVADVASQVLGIVAEVAVPAGHDVLACYRDGSARYMNFSGSLIAYEGGLASVDAALAALLAVSQTVADVIGPWDSPQLPPLPDGHTRFVMLTPSGPRFGQGPDAALRSDRVASTLLSAATGVLTALIAADASGGSRTKG